VNFCSRLRPLPYQRPTRTATPRHCGNPAPTMVHPAEQLSSFTKIAHTKHTHFCQPKHSLSLAKPQKNRPAPIIHLDRLYKQNCLWLPFLIILFQRTKMYVSFVCLFLSLHRAPTPRITISPNSTTSPVMQPQPTINRINSIP
jgi:hypothetical protein